MFWISPGCLSGWFRLTVRNGGRRRGHTPKNTASSPCRAGRILPDLGHFTVKTAAPGLALCGSTEGRWTSGGCPFSTDRSGAEKRPSVRGTGAQQPCWGQGATPIGGLRAAVLIGSRVKRLAQLELMPASTRTGYYLTQAPQVRQLRSPPASPGIGKKERGILD